MAITGVDLAYESSSRDGSGAHYTEVYKVKSGAKKDEIQIQMHPHGIVEKKMHRSNEWISLAPDLILPLIKILKEWYVELNKEEVPETTAFEKVSEDKELSKDIEDIGL